MKSCLFAFLLILTNLGLCAQSKLEIGLIGSPSINQIVNEHNRPKQLESINYGVRLNIVKQKVNFSTGILHQTYGYKHKIAVTTVDRPDGTGELALWIFRSKAIAIPLNIEYKFLKKPKMELFADLGVYFQYFYSERVTNTSVPKNQTNNDGNLEPKRYYEGDLFPDFNIAPSIGVGLRYKVNNNLNFQFKPHFLCQSVQDAFLINSFYSNSYSIDLGLFYTLKN